MPSIDPGPVSTDFGSPSPGKTPIGVIKTWAGLALAFTGEAKDTRYISDTIGVPQSTLLASGRRGGTRRLGHLQHLEALGLVDVEPGTSGLELTKPTTVTWNAVPRADGELLQPVGRGRRVSHETEQRYPIRWEGTLLTLCEGRWAEGALGYRGWLACIFMDSKTMSGADIWRGSEVLHERVLRALRLPADAFPLPRRSMYDTLDRLVERANEYDIACARVNGGWFAFVDRDGGAHSEAMMRRNDAARRLHSRTTPEAWAWYQDDLRPRPHRGGGRTLPRLGQGGHYGSFSEWRRTRPPFLRGALEAQRASEREEEVERGEANKKASHEDLLAFLGETYA